MGASGNSGRPRESRVDRAIERAVRELITESGYAALTMDAVAARAGVGKAAIYRRHSSKAELAVAVLVHKFTVAPLPDTGSLRGDLLALATEIHETLLDPAVAAAGPGFLADLAASPELTARVKERYFVDELAEITTLLTRAVDRGDLAAMPANRLVHAIMLGATFAWLSILHHDPDPDLPRQLADFVHTGLTAYAP